MEEIQARISQLSLPTTFGTSCLQNSNYLQNLPSDYCQAATDDLGVFEAAWYFSKDEAVDCSAATYASVSKREEGRFTDGKRRSSELCRKQNSQVQQRSDRRPAKCELQSAKTVKQPNSPGARRLASFLNTIFSQSAGKTKSKASAASTKLNRNGKTDEYPWSHNCSKQKIGKSASFSNIWRQPVASRQNSEETRCTVDDLNSTYHSQVGSANEDHYFSRLRNKSNALIHQQGDENPVFLSERIRRMSNTGFFDILGQLDHRHLVQKDLIISHDGSTMERWTLNKDTQMTEETCRVDWYSTPEVNFWRSEEEDDGWSSDSSSDLFELPSCKHIKMYRPRQC